MRPEPFRPRTWPLSVKVPLQAALFTFVVALVTTQAAMILVAERERSIVAGSFAVLAVGVAAQVAPVLPGGPEAARTALESIVETLGTGLYRRIEIAWTDEAGSRRTVSAFADAPFASSAGAATAEEATDADDGLAVTRAFQPEGGTTTVVVTVVADAASTSPARLDEQLRIALVDLALAFIGAAVAIVYVRSTLAPVEALTANLLDDRRGRPPELDALAPLSTEFGRLQRLMNERIAAEEERADALVRLAEQERTAGLAKLAASIAHEVRNPLAGLMNAVSTLRRFGDDPAARRESLDLIARGLASIDRVAGAALATYRPAAGETGFGPRDLADLEVLAAPEARRRGVRLSVTGALDAAVAVDGALLRQVLLNLLLNAVKASGSGGETRLSATCEGDTLTVSVTDAGPGLPGDVRRFLAGGKADPFPKPGALGLWTVMRLLDDIDGRLSIDSHPGKGTTITIHVPAAPASGNTSPTATGAAVRGAA